MNKQLLDHKDLDFLETVFSVLEQPESANTVFLRIEYLKINLRWRAFYINVHF